MGAEPVAVAPPLRVRADQRGQRGNRASRAAPSFMTTTTRSTGSVVKHTGQPAEEHCGKLACHVTLWSSRSLGDDRQDGAGHHTGAACVDLSDQAPCGPHVRAWCAHSRYAKSGGRFHPCRPGVEPRRCGVGHDAKHWGSFNEALSTVATRRAISARSRIPRKNLFQARLALSRAPAFASGTGSNDETVDALRAEIASLKQIILAVGTQAMRDAQVGNKALYSIDKKAGSGLTPPRRQQLSGTG